MVETTALRRSALAGHVRPGLFGAVGQSGPAVRLSEARPAALVHCATSASDASALVRLADVLGARPPTVPNTWAACGGGGRIYWTGPGRWLVAAGTGDGEGWRERLAAATGARGAAVDVSAGRTVVLVAGPAAAEVLAKGCPLDLHARVFGEYACAQTLLGALSVLIARRPEGQGFEVFVARSYGLDLWDWLLDAIAEFGGEVRAADSWR